MSMCINGSGLSFGFRTQSMTEGVKIHGSAYTLGKKQLSACGGVSLDDPHGSVPRNADMLTCCRVSTEEHRHEDDLE